MEMWTTLVHVLTIVFLVSDPFAPSNANIEGKQSYTYIYSDVVVTVINII